MLGAPSTAPPWRRRLRELATRIAGWRAAQGADAALAADYRARSLTIGSRVRASLPGDRAVEGTATDIDDLGRLCIDTDGETRDGVGRRHHAFTVGQPVEFPIVGYPDNVLAEDEQVVLHRHPHWKRLIGPVLLLILGTAGGVRRRRRQHDGLGPAAKTVV